MPGDINDIKDNEDYKLREILDFEHVIPFIIRNIKRKGILSLFYFTLNIVSLLLLVIISVTFVIHDNVGIGQLIQYIFFGIFAGSILIVPVHEMFHFLAYFFMGARSVKFGADPRQLIFYVVADKFPIGRIRLAILAMAPFVIINLLTAIFILPLIPAGTIIGGFLLVTHNIMCIGDFAVLNFALQKENKGLVTFDDVKKKESYFYVKTV
ncbi:MAG: DUF3267 domain-containing protein [Bacteroidales bacterium]|nr:DUF3267 domain-containing protein [Bacteroidales bacterium]MBN2697605.1 DUF3267 domain-containing protein [Bacteroidales bacterium]